MNPNKLLPWIYWLSVVALFGWLPWTYVPIEEFVRPITMIVYWLVASYIWMRWVKAKKE